MAQGRGERRWVRGLQETQALLQLQIGVPCSPALKTRELISSWLFPQPPCHDPLNLPPSLPALLRVCLALPPSRSHRRHFRACWAGLRRQGQGLLWAFTQRQTLGKGLRNQQSHHIHSCKLAMVFDPVIPLFGIPPEDIIAKAKIAIYA